MVDRKIRTALRTNQIAGFVSMNSREKIKLRYSLTVAWLALANKALDGPELSLFCRDTGLLQGRSISFVRSNSLLPSETKTVI